MYNNNTLSCTTTTHCLVQQQHIVFYNNKTLSCYNNNTLSYLTTTYCLIQQQHTVLNTSTHYIKYNSNNTQQQQPVILNCISITVDCTAYIFCLQNKQQQIYKKKHEKRLTNSSTYSEPMISSQSSNIKTKNRNYSQGRFLIIFYQKKAFLFHFWRAWNRNWLSAARHHEISVI